MSFRPDNAGNILGQMKVLQRLNPYTFAVEIAIMREGVNNNRWDYRNLEKHYKTFMGQPILIAYVNGKIGDGHNMRTVYQANGEQVFTFTDGTAERIIGTLSEDEGDFSIQNRDGKNWIVAKGKIYSFYAREAVEKIVAAGVMNVSAETDVFGSKKAPDGVEIFEDWAGLGVTILGDDVPPAIPGARIKAAALLREAMETMKLRAAALEKGDDSPLKKPAQGAEPKGVNAKMNKRELAALQKLFPQHIVLGASDDGMHVCLLSKANWAPGGYTFPSADDRGYVSPERIAAMQASATFAFGEDNVTVDMGDALDAMSASLMRANSELEEARKHEAELEAQIKTMQEKEQARRVEACKAAVNSKLEALNANRDAGCAFGNELAEKVCAMIEKGCFVGDEEDGKWVGDAHAVHSLMALCMEAQEAQDKAHSGKKGFSWNSLIPGESHNDGSPEALISWVNQ